MLSKRKMLVITGFLFLVLLGEFCFLFVKLRAPVPTIEKTYFPVAPIEKEVFASTIIKAIIVRFLYVFVIGMIIMLLVYRKTIVSRIKEVLYLSFLITIGSLVIVSPLLIWEYLSAPEGYAITENELVIFKKGGVEIYSLNNLNYAEKDVLGKFDVSSVKVKGKLGVINGRWGTYGKFSTEEYSFKMYATNLNKLVVLGWQDKYVVISPNNPEKFISLIKTKII